MRQNPDTTKSTGTFIDLKQRHQPVTPGPDEILQSVTVQNGQEGIPCLVQYSPHTTGSGDRAARFGTVDNYQITLHQPDHLTHVNRSRFVTKLNSAPLPPGSAYKSGATEFMHHLHEMVAGNGISPCDLSDGRQPFRLAGQVDQDAEGVIRMACQVHCSITSVKDLNLLGL